MSSAASYSRLDRLLHRIAFSALGAQIAVADLEDRAFARRLERITVERPVFITSLPRAGTTLLLEILARAPGFATHSYRNMPFVMCPLLWNALSRRFHAQPEPRERAHGDGMMVDYDSPEALEEVVWKAFWPRKYRSDRITTWTAGDRDAEFEAFLETHIRKIIALAPETTETRYVSKNNANIARLELLQSIFPDCTILVPIREPWSHIGSLLAQHRRFSEIHARDPFARRYMTWLGHHEFGFTLKPIDFGGWLDGAGCDAPESIGYWARYWLAWATALVATTGDNICVFDYERACTDPRASLTALAHVLRPVDSRALSDGASRFRAARRHEVGEELVDPILKARIDGVYAKLNARAV